MRALILVKDSDHIDKGPFHYFTDEKWLNIKNIHQKSISVSLFPVFLRDSNGVIKYVYENCSLKYNPTKDIDGFSNTPYGALRTGDDGVKTIQYFTYKKNGNNVLNDSMSILKFKKLNLNNKPILEVTIFSPGHKMYDAYKALLIFGSEPRSFAKKKKNDNWYDNYIIIEEF